MHDSDSNPCLSRKSGEHTRVPQSGKDKSNEDSKDWEEIDYKNAQQTADETQQQQQAGLARRAVGGLFSLGAGVVGAGFGGVKWVAGTTYSVGSGVIAKIRPASYDPSKDKKD